MCFRDAVDATESLYGAYRPGLQALERRDRERIRSGDPRNLSGSVNLDRALKESHPGDARWDYGIGVKVSAKLDRVTWVEVHPASSHHIDKVLEKHRWLKRWLATSAPLLSHLDREFVWIASGSVAIPPNSPQRRVLAREGIRFAGSHLEV